MDKKILSEFIDAAGNGNVLYDEKDLFPYKRGSIDRIEEMPEIAIKIFDEKSISKIMKIAHKYRIPVIARGGGSSPTGAVVPEKKGIVLDMRPLNAISVNIRDGYVEAYAGATLEEVNNESRKYGFFFPPDPSSVSISTVGGAINENSGGMRCARYGVVKDWILKIDVVLSSGDETSFGESIYKNRGGFNFVDLICGSEGTLCIVKKAYLKIMPLPEKITRIAGFFNTIEESENAIFSIRKNGLNPLILEYADYYGIKAANEIKKWNYPEAHGGMVLVDTDYGENYLSKIQNVLEENNAFKIFIPGNEEEYNNIFEIRRIAFAAPGLLFKGFIDGDIVVPLSKLTDAIEGINQVRIKNNVYIATCGHAGDGNLHPQIGGNPDNISEWENVKKSVREINDLAVRLGGSISGEHGIGKIKEDDFIRQLKYKNQIKTLEFMKSVKKIFDPENILNPGNFALGGNYD